MTQRWYTRTRKTHVDSGGLQERPVMTGGFPILGLWPVVHRMAVAEGKGQGQSMT